AAVGELPAQTAGAEQTPVAEGLRLQRSRYALVPENGQLPTPLAFTVPEILSPSTEPLNSSVRGMGFLMAALKLRALPLALPSRSSVELPSSLVILPERLAPVLV